MDSNPSQNVCVRSMVQADVPAVRHLVMELGFSGTPDAVADRFMNMSRFPFHQSFVADLPGSSAVGWVHIYEAPSLLTEPTAEVGGMAVAPSFRRMGVGAALMCHAQHWARDRGCTSLLLATHVGRSEAQAFYQSLGYEIEFSTYFMRRDLTSLGSGLGHV